MKARFRIFTFLILTALGFACNSQQVHEDIVIVGIDTLDREGIANLIGIINQYDPKVLSLDINFVGATEYRKDWELVWALRECKNLIMGSAIWNYTGYETTYERFFDESQPEFLINAKVGYTNGIFEGDETRTWTRFSAYEQVRGLKHFHFGVMTAMAFDSSTTNKFLHLNPKVVDIKFSTDRRFKKFTSLDVFESRVTAEDLSGKIVLLGYLGPGMDDMFYTPLNEHKKRPDMYGVEIMANIVAQILEEP
jgi:CHASE2 domain-containing sensor protein